MPLEIVIWDTDAERIAEIDRNLYSAFKELGIKGLVTCNAEPPSLARAGLMDRVPVLEIAGKYWSREPGKALSVDACVKLLEKLGFAKLSQ